MTSGTFATISLSSIILDDTDRQRRELKGIEELASSIAQIGLLQPPVITRDNLLVAGRRRIAAMQMLGWHQTPVQYTDEVEPDRLQLLELEENTKRIDLSWLEQHEAIVKYHILRKKANPAWTHADSARELSLSEPHIAQQIRIAYARQQAPDLNIEKADSFSTARGLAERFAERRNANAVQETNKLLGIPASPVATHIQKPLASSAANLGERKNTGECNILCDDFLTYEPARRFNLIHCDFPYGIDTGSKKQGFSKSKRFGSYADSKDIYFALLSRLLDLVPELCDDQCHLMFWFHMKFYEPTVKALTEGGFVVNPIPLIWAKSDNSGIIADPERGPRNTYETCLLASRGDRKVVRAVSNVFYGPIPKTLHAHEKSGEMLRHFFRMLVDGSTTILDPTCGSGSSLKAAIEGGANYALGLELNPEFADRARGSMGLVRRTEAIS